MPSSSPGRLCSELTPGPLDAFISPAAGRRLRRGRSRGVRGCPFGHLLNLFHAANQTGGTPAHAIAAARPDAGLRRSPARPIRARSGGTRRRTSPWPGHAAPIDPPFNKASRFRDPGGSTSTRSSTSGFGLAAIANAQLQDRTAAARYWNDIVTDPFFTQLALSRQGYHRAAF